MATKTAAQFTVRYEITGDECEDAEPWKIYSPDGEFESCRETEAEAIAFAAECNESLAEETEAAEECEREELIRELQDRIEEMSLSELRKLAKRLGF